MDSRHHKHHCCKWVTSKRLLPMKSYYLIFLKANINFSLGKNAYTNQRIVEGKVNGLPNAGSLSFSTVDVLGGIILAWEGIPYCALQDVEQHAWSLPTRCQLWRPKLSPNIAACPLVGREDCLSSTPTSPLQCVTQGNAIPFYQTILPHLWENSPKGVVISGTTTLFFLAMEQCPFFSYPHISEVPENRVNRSLQGSLSIAMLTWMEDWGKEHFS